MEYYFEILTVLDIFSLAVNYLLLKKSKKIDFNVIVFWVDASAGALKLLLFLKSTYRFRIERLNFQLIKIRNINGELVRVQIPLNDLFIFWNLIECNKSILSGYAFPISTNSRFQFFLRKQLLDGGIPNQDSISRVLYLINVAAQSNVNSQSHQRVLVLQNRPWKKEYAQYAEALEVKLRWAVRLPPFFNLRRFVRNFLFNFPRIYKLIRRFRGANFTEPNQSKSGKIFIQGRGDARLVNDGNNSDFDWLLQSEFPRERVVYQCPDEASKLSLSDSGIQTVLDLNFRENTHKGILRKPVTSEGLAGLSSLEKHKLETLKQDYEWGKLKWSGFFNQNDIKVFMTWFKYDGIHAVMADAIQSLGGISAVNQVAFDGFRNFECQMSVDLAFGFSRWSAQVEKELKSEIPYFVITGYPRDHAKPLLEVQAKKLRNQLQRAGASKIIFSIDENSLDDARWHAGHAFQQEHYRYVLEKVLEYPWLGAVFKPKAPSTLRQRLGDVSKLLLAAEQTGRCIVLETRHTYTSVESVLLAGLASDVCIHGHLSAGTAALECALAGLPTLLVNREQISHSILNKLPYGSVVFNDWPTTMAAVMEYFSSKTGIPGFGEWGGMLDELDPFRDGKASQRIGTYLNWLLEGFDHGWDREKNLAEAAERYRNCWGADTIVTIG